MAQKASAPAVSPSTTVNEADRFAPLDALLKDAVQKGRAPGAVLLVGHNGTFVYRKAFGYRALDPSKEPMTVDTIFDLASLTKVMATTSCVMRLVQLGQVKLNDPVAKYIPEFAHNGKDDVTVRQLLTNYSGLRPDLDLKQYWSGLEEGYTRANAEKLMNPPGSVFVYSDINFVVLGELVQRVGGMPLDQYAQTYIFGPLGMTSTRFLPPADWKPRIAPTERDERTGQMLRGVAHDPTARRMGGVAGDAGLFSTADDVAKFAQALLNGGAPVFSPWIVEKMTTPQQPPNLTDVRGLGWDIDSPFSSNRGELLPVGSFGHTGFTGTSLWIDPHTQTYVILLANSIHPSGHSSLTALRGKVATIAAAALGIETRGLTLTGYSETFTAAGVHREVGRNAATRSGLDVMVERDFQPLVGKRVGLITNQTGVDRLGRRNVDLMRRAGISVAALFSPEHGLAGREDQSEVHDATDTVTGIRIYSLYGATPRPTPEMLRGVDALVFDIQDIGARFWTYETTLVYAMEAAAKAGIPFYVLDRPNPIGGTHVEGPLLDAANTSFVGYVPGLPVRHGMTMGELARLVNSEEKIGAALTVISIEDWRRGDWFDSTNLPWINPSPNMRSLNAATLYPGLCLLEAAKNFSVGRGTDAPFEQVGADFMGGRELAGWLNSRQIPGVRAYATSFTPTESNFRGVRIEGVRFQVTNRELFDATRLGLELAAAIQKFYPGKIDFRVCRGLIGSDDVIRRLAAGEDARTIQQSFSDAVAGFVELRGKYLLYR